MTIDARPSRDPANDESMPGTFQDAMRKMLRRTDDMLPAKVLSYNRAKNRARVQPLVSMVTTEGEVVSRAPVASLPVMQLGGGGFVLSFPMAPGDLGWIKANDRDISLFLQAYKEAKPNTARMHTFEDALFIPDVMTGYTIAGEDAGNVVLQTNGGSVRVAVWSDRIKMTAGSHVVTIGPSGVTITSSAITINGPTTINSTLSVSGAATFTSGANIGGIEFGTHGHTGIQPGGGTSGGPTG